MSSPELRRGAKPLASSTRRVGIEPAGSEIRTWSWLTSVALHVALGLVLLFARPFTSRDVPAERSLDVQLVLRGESDEPTDDLPGETAAATATNASEPAPTPTPPTETPVEQRQPPVPSDTTTALLEAGAALPMESIPSPDLPPLPALELPDLDVSPGGLPSRTLDLPLADAVGGRARTRFFDAEAVGRSFVYVIDRSASMEHALPYAKQELLRSLESLAPEHRFQIIFYNNAHDTMPLEGGTLTAATRDHRRYARKFLDDMRAEGGTAHQPAIRRALELDPEVVYFLTDADNMSLAEVAAVTATNHGAARPATIHTIQFAAGPEGDSETPLQRLARENAGTHVHVDLIARAWGRSGGTP